MKEHARNERRALIEALSVRDAEFLPGEREVLVMIARGAPIEACLDRLVHTVEEQVPGMRASILVLDPGGTRLRHGAAPSLPPEYVRRIDGSEIGPAAGSCGTAAFTGEAVAVRDIAADPRWENYRAFALPHGLRACWSTPIRDPTRGILGTFAMYYGEPALPQSHHLRLIELATDLAAVALGRERDRLERAILLTANESATRDAVAAEQALAREALRRRTWFQQTFEAAFVLDEDIRIVEANPAFLRLIGREAGEVLGRHAWELGPKHASRSSVAADHGLGPVRDGVVGSLLQRADGTLLEVEVSHSTAELDGRREVFCVCRDVTERNAAARALRESVDRFRLPFQRTNVAMCLARPYGRITEVNDAMCELLGYERHELEGVSVLEITHPDDREESREGIARLLRGASTSWRLTKRFVQKRGGVVSADVSATLLRDGAGVPLSLVIHVVDVTERNQLEEQLRHAQRIESLGRLAGGVAHDFNNLLTVINSFAELAQLHIGESDPVRPMLEQIEAAGRRGGSLTQQLLTFSRRQTVRRAPLHLGEVVSALEPMLRRLLGEDIALRLRVASGLPAVVADAGEVEQVVMNLVANARDAMPNGGSLEISVDRTSVEGEAEPLAGTHVRLRVTDSGIGIVPAMQQKIFDPFFTTKPAGRGTGLGLATVQGIVQDCRGVVRVESAPGEGTTFQLLLPGTDRAVEGAPASDRFGLARGSETVLVVEDDPMVRELSRCLLEEAGYRVLTASDGEEALAVAESQHDRIALVVTDVVMPRMSGVELAERLRALGVRSVLFTSGYAPELARVEDTAAFLAKPFTAESLTQAVRELLDA